MTTRRDDGADQPRCGHVHHHESNGGLGRMGHNAIDAKPWCEPCPVPAAPPPAPTEDAQRQDFAKPRPDLAELVAELRALNDAPWNVSDEMAEAADALERLAADLAAAREGWQNGMHEERDGPGNQPCVCGNDWPCLRWAEPSPYDYATAMEAAAREEARADLAESRLALVRHALLADGYFTDDEIGPDLAPRVTERFSAYASAVDLEVEAFKRQPMSQQCRDGDHGLTCYSCRCLCHIAEAERDDLRAQVAAVRALCASAPASGFLTPHDVRAALDSATPGATEDADV